MIRIEPSHADSLLIYGSLKLGAPSRHNQVATLERSSRNDLNSTLKIKLVLFFLSLIKLTLVPLKYIELT